MFRLKRGLFAALSGFALVSLVWGLRSALHLNAIEGWSEVGLDWLVLEQWTQEWCWQMGLLGAAAGFGFGWLYGKRPAEGRSPRIMERLGGLLGHPAVALLLMFATRYGPGISAANLEPATGPGDPNVVLVVVDTWRADHTSFLGYERESMPELGRLAEKGVVFEQAIAQSGWTKPSVATILTGMLPQRHLAVSQPGRDGPRRGVNLKPGMHTLVEVMRAKGWRTGMWSNNPNIIPERGFGQGTRDFVAYRRNPDPSSKADPGRAEFMLPRVERFLEMRRNRSRPFFAYVHIMDPHLPYQAPAPFGGKFDQSGLDFQIGPRELQAYQSGELTAEDVTPAMLQRILDAYDEELAYVDHHLGAFIEGMLERYPNTIIMLVGDHGEEFLEHGQFGHAHALYEELVHVPFVLWAPDLRPQRVGYQVRLMDLMPTLLDLTGLLEQLNIDFQGQSLLPMLLGEELGHRLAPMETGGEGHPNFHWRGISDGRFKLLRRELDPVGSTGGETIHPWESKRARPFFSLYDLELDPGETNDLQASEPARVQELMDSFQARGWYRSPASMFGQGELANDASEAELQHLNELGYGGSQEEDQ